MMLRNALLAATILALPAAAIAQPISGLYVGAGVGADYQLDTNAKLNATSTKIKEHSPGVAGNISAGYGLGNGFRVELEFSGRDIHNNVKTGGLAGGGTEYTYGPMINGLYDFNLGGPITPYLGVGGGYQWTTLSGYNVYPASAGKAYGVSSSAKGAPAAQGIVGVAYAIPGAPGLAVTGEYRFLATLSNDKFGTTPSGTFKTQNQYHNELLVGLRYAFGVAPAPVAATPAPAPVAAPAPAAAHSYLVFFDWDKADLTARAQQIIAEAAAASRSTGSTKIGVAGHADRTGTEVYNQALSLRRANNVAAELVRLGVPKTAISISAFGDTKPLVPTAAGVREPQNRRVEIVLQ
jgi:outer membrane protein OmpA-like peptidoglycan-associated protein